ncbi:MAG: FKBP-type peptidyl-prolyl cis-trans isomerase [Bacteroidales bacterium]|jgi:FKBP-type peptidyl-prolyl cis-trans isomerase|nr:FKBP-type peptidyl-prolyl cis-trans isomerase [Bacteroidales bacterium]MDD4257648.1 FKBP-type peptidyl-prolyl cis-trans isomerase [Bacteroidales bacterium]MDD4653774.1 FKBP-type peptidyl-prolyl cis-trans isomerase [Bacteroidales bacterium]
MKKFPQLITAALIAGVCAGMTSCAENTTESLKDIHEKILAAHVKTIHHDTLQKTESGLYYTILKAGHGASTTDSSCVFIRETVYDLNYNITESTDENISRQLGTFSYEDAYIPLLWYMGNSAIMMGLEEMLLQMREGDVRRIWLPYWLSAYYEDGTSQNSSTQVYDLELVKVVNDIDKYQIDTLESFRDRFYPGLDSLERGFYKMTIVPGTGDSLEYGTTVSAYYVGKFLDGHVFDTNVADTAVKYRIYDSSGEYSLLDVTLPDEDDEDSDDTSTEDGSVVEGFSKCMLNMKYGEVAICFFHSDYGYGYSGDSDSSVSGTYPGGGIPAYMPLFFWIYVPLDEDDS